MKPHLQWQFKLSPFWIVLKLAFVPNKPIRGRERYILLFGFCAGKHNFTQILASGYEFGLWPPQSVAGINKFRGLHLVKVTHYGLTEQKR